MTIGLLSNTPSLRVLRILSDARFAGSKRGGRILNEPGNNQMTINFVALSGSRSQFVRDRLLTAPWITRAQIEKCCRRQMPRCASQVTRSDWKAL